MNLVVADNVYHVILQRLPANLRYDMWTSMVQRS